ncbi:unnamed protein product [Didymodactylos carnosus]|uniref:Mediator of RNA polymerase II transcription subunit 9 n=1 Tax=Didymodactylos carnosus TaxID=1234261 RepID=A0A813ZK08_9BILA|nr:unnamed protein product [Didymodactylos carnosus]CAF0899998.1 unnamed protein product [Didymodactylos carnosus]CAF3548147.1 unnamed protein product [Didymodactylos carnosus]CAF3682628.1 unnamed protein product [Didymodactylos carnosus]
MALAFPSVASNYPMNSSDVPTTTTNVKTDQQQNFDEETFNFLPRLTDILKNTEKKSSDVKIKLDELQKQFELCHDIIQKIDGIDYSVNEQQEQLNRTNNELISKTHLLKKHINLAKFDLNAPSPPPSHTTTNMNNSNNESINAMNIDDDLFLMADAHPTNETTNFSATDYHF